MIGLMMPEVVLYNLLNNIIKLLRTDLQQNIQAHSEQNSILYRILGVDEWGSNLKLNFYDFYKQAKKVLSLNGNLKVHYGYSQDTTTAVDICILLPKETGEIGIGGDEGYLEEVGEDGYQNYYTQTFKSDYQLMITSNNNLEVLVVYTILKCALLMLLDQLELFGFRNPKISGQDIVMQEDLTPVPLFHKVLDIEFMYENNVPQRLKVDFLNKITAMGSFDENFNTDGVGDQEPGVYAEIERNT